MVDVPSSTNSAAAPPLPDTTASQPPLPRKRQLFKNRPAWSSQPAAPSNLTRNESATDDDDDPLRAFSRAKDSFQLIQEAEERARQQKVKEREEAEQKETEEKRRAKEREIEPVSYTHLTLPTKRIV